LSDLDATYVKPAHLATTVPSVDSIIWAKLPPSVRDRDRLLQKLQHELQLGLRPLMHAADTLTKAADRAQPIQPQQVGALLQQTVDALAVFLSTNTKLNYHRRMDIRPHLTHCGLCNKEIPVASLLYPLLLPHR